MDKIDYSGGWSNNLRLPLEEAISHGIEESKCYVYRLSVPAEGGSTYIGFTSQNPQERLSQHLESARSDSFKKVHKELRKFGFMHEFHVIGEYSNEVMALVSEINSIKKFNAALNSTIGGEGNRYSVIPGKNHLNEEIFFVQDNLKAKLHDEELVAISDAHSSLKIMKHKLISTYGQRLEVIESRIADMFDQNEISRVVIDRNFNHDLYDCGDLFSGLLGNSDEIINQGAKILHLKEVELEDFERKIKSIIEEPDSEFAKKFKDEVDSLIKVENYLITNGFHYTMGNYWKRPNYRVNILYDFMPGSSCKEKYIWRRYSYNPFKNKREADRFINKIKSDRVINFKAISKFILVWKSYMSFTNKYRAEFYPDGKEKWFSRRDVYIEDSVN